MVDGNVTTRLRLDAYLQDGYFPRQSGRKLAQTFLDVGTRFPSQLAPAVKKGFHHNRRKRVNPLTQNFRVWCSAGHTF